LKTQTFQPGNREKEILLKLARKSITSLFKPSKEEAEITYDEWLSSNLGAFVSLHLKSGELRGCIGRFSSQIPLYSLIPELAVSAARKDYRFSPVKDDELKNLVIEISVLSPLQRIHSLDEIRRGVHGIYIKSGNHSGTYLPQVILDTDWDIETFVRRCSSDKAGLGPDGWKTAEMYVYTAEIFSEQQE